uniref:Uncharacterized protein n=1 Tax=Panagrolaimus sp. JU765 TaxID=591449 RepID=A0AC34RQZ9_9BILA
MSATRLIVILTACVLFVAIIDACTPTHYIPGPPGIPGNPAVPVFIVTSGNGRRRRSPNNQEMIIVLPDTTDPHIMTVAYDKSFEQIIHHAPLLANVIPQKLDTVDSENIEENTVYHTLEKFTRDECVKIQKSIDVAQLESVYIYCN